MRLFVSVDPPPSVQLQLSQWLPEINGVKKTPPGQLHLTLLFLGNQPDDAVPDIVARLQEITFDPFEISISGIGAFPNTRYPSVIWAGTEGDPSLMKLQNDISDKLAGYQRDDSVKPFHPHITLARVKNRKDLKGRKIFSMNTDTMHFRAEQIWLKKSELHPEGAVHEVIKSFG